MSKTTDTAPDSAAAAVPETPLAVRIQGAKAWTPAKDRAEAEMLTGTVVAVVARSSEHGTYPCVIIDTTGTPGGMLSAFHAFHTVALDQLKELKPSPGESIVIIAYPKTEARKRLDSEGKPVRYTPYSIYNPDAEQTVTANWSWDDAEASAPAVPGF